MKRNPDASALFNKFAGRVIPMSEDCVETPTGGYTRIAPRDPADPLLAEMHDFAHENGLSLRVLWPGEAETKDFRASRVSVNLERGADHKWRVGKTFSIG